MKIFLKENPERRGEHGSVLLYSLVVCGALGLILAGYLGLVASQHRASYRSMAWNAAIPVAEAGMEEAMAHLYRRGDHLILLGQDRWGFWNGAYHKRRTIAGGVYRVSISNTVPPVIYSVGWVQIPGTQDYVSRTIRAETEGGGRFIKAMIARDEIDLNGNNVRTDSFDSTDPLLSTDPTGGPFVYGLYDPAKARDNGDVASTSGIEGAVSVGNADIHGRVFTGPGGTVSIGPNGAVGSDAWHAAGSSGIEPGYVFHDMNMSFPNAERPFSGGYSTPGGGWVGGTNYTYVLNTGDYQLYGLQLSGQKRILVQGQARLMVEGDVSFSGQSYLYVAPGGSLEMYVAGSDVRIAGNGLVNSTGQAKNLILYGLPSNTRIEFGGNAGFVGAIYAPDADFHLGGGGNDTYDFIGAAVIRSVKMNGHFNFHYDESLSEEGPPRAYLVRSWHEI